MSTVYLLSRRTEWEIHCFEKANQVGLDAANVEITVLKDGKSLDVGIDVPMRSIDSGISLGRR